VTQGAGRIAPSLNFSLWEKKFLLVKNVFKKYKIWGWKYPHFKENSGAKLK